MRVPQGRDQPAGQQVQRVGMRVVDREPSGSGRRQAWPGIGSGGEAAGLPGGVSMLPERAGHSPASGSVACGRSSEASRKQDG